MDLLSILQNGANSLNTHRAATATASHNLQNVNTPGYSRQRVALTATLPMDRVGGAYIGRGVTLQTVTQTRDQFLERQMPAALSTAAHSSAEAGVLGAVSALNLDATGGISDQLSGFYSSLRALTQAPGDSGLRQAAVSSARTLALAFNRTSQSLEETRTGVDARLQGTAEEVNTLAAGMASLNVKIHTARAGGHEPNDLLDARLRMQDRLTELTGAVPVPSGDGHVGMALPGGTALVIADRAARLSVLPDAANGGHLALQIQGTDGRPPGALPNTSVGGTLGGLVDARDGALANAVSGLDSLAFDFAQAFNTVHQGGVAQDGSTGRPLFDAGATAAGAAARFSVDGAISSDPRLLATGATAAPGDGTRLMALVQTESQALASSGTSATETVARITSQFGAAASRSRTTAEHDQGLRDFLSDSRDAASGVSIDEELIELQKSQRAFEAATRVIQTADEMLDTLMQLK